MEKKEKKEEVLYFKRAKKTNTWLSILVEKNPVKPAHMVTSIKQSPVLKGSPFSCPVIENFI